MVRMWKKPVAEFLTGGLNLLPLVPLCKLQQGKPITTNLREIVREIDRRLAQQPDHAKAVRLMTATFVLTGMRVAKESLAEIFDGVKIMHESTACDMILDEGEARGEIKGEIRLLLIQGRERLGRPSEKTVAKLKSITDIQRLERMGKAILTAKSWSEFLATE